ncbi:MAG TPA: hypothetical protein K8V31_06075, partial [Bifidobacterium pullorum]|nr:hypothetical protein [Bifidobacterium pullorum]
MPSGSIAEGKPVPHPVASAWHRMNKEYPSMTAPNEQPQPSAPSSQPEYGAMANQYPAGYDPYVYGRPDAEPQPATAAPSGGPSA